MFNESLFHLLIDLVPNAFDDVRSLAASFLERFPKDVFAQLATLGTKTSGTPTKGYSILSLAQKRMQITGRADLADGYGRLKVLFSNQMLPNEGASTLQREALLCVLHQLECDVGIARSRLANAVADSPIHGRLIAMRYTNVLKFGVQNLISLIRYLVSSAEFNSSLLNHEQHVSGQSCREFHDRLFSCCVQVWDTVKPILCVDSPEGQGDDEEKEADIGVKDTLSFSWRALKESR